MNERYGLKISDRQYARYMLGIFTGDLGVSFQFSNTVTDLLSGHVGPCLIGWSSNLVQYIIWYHTRCYFSYVQEYLD